MPPYEKRKKNKSGQSIVAVEEIPLWPVLYKVNETTIKESIQKQASCVHLLKKRFNVRDDVNRKISLWQGDITKLQVSAIINAANETLLGGGGVDGSIHRAAGPELVKECRLLNGCSPGEAKLTSGHKLPARYIIHTVGPWGKVPSKLQECYKNCLQLILENDIKSVAFCCISTGVCGYPNQDAAHVALVTVRKWLEKYSEKVDRIIFCTFLLEDFEIYQDLMADKYFPCIQDVSEETRKLL